MKTILVSGASGIVGYGTLRSLKKSALELRLIGTSIYSDSVASGFCDLFLQAQPTNDASYMAWLLDVITQHKIDMIIPCIEIDMYKWCEHLQEIVRCGAHVMLNDVTLIRLCRDKWAFFENLSSAGLTCMIDSSLDSSYEALRSKFGLPFLLKPRQGFGSKGIVRVEDESIFSTHLDKVGESLMAQAFAGSDEEEYTTSAFCDGEGGFYACMTLRRKLSKDGFTEKAEVVPTDEFLPTMRSLCAHLRPHGPTNFQFRKCDDGIKLLEINPRISSSTSIRTAFGYNESAMAVEYYLDNKTPSQPMIRRGKAVRYIEDLIFYENSIYL
jgi:carbamoyl-phosphate synthase large subunit